MGIIVLTVHLYYPLLTFFWHKRLISPHVLTHWNHEDEQPSTLAISLWGNVTKGKTQQKLKNLRTKMFTVFLFQWPKIATTVKCPGLEKSFHKS